MRRHRNEDCGRCRQKSEMEPHQPDLALGRPTVTGRNQIPFDDMHSNTAEGFFSILKRGVIGTYHHWSPAHLHRYLAEFDFRCSTRSLTDAERTAEGSKGALGKRLTYRQPSSFAAELFSDTTTVWGAA